MTKRIERIIKILEKRYNTENFWKEPFELLISTILSQRTKDEVTHKAAKSLLKVANKPEKILKLSKKQIEKLIYPVGFYKQKAKRIKEVCKILLEKYGGKVPNKREKLLKLPGVGGKTADIVLAYGFNKPVIAVDTHVAIISRRLGLTKNSDPEKIREDLHKAIPKKYRKIINLLFVNFGKEICRSVNPRCEVCPIKKFCKELSSNKT